MQINQWSLEHCLHRRVEHAMKLEIIWFCSPAILIFPSEEFLFLTVVQLFHFTVVALRVNQQFVLLFLFFLWLSNVTNLLTRQFSHFDHWFRRCRRLRLCLLQLFRPRHDMLLVVEVGVVGDVWGLPTIAAQLLTANLGSILATSLGFIGSRLKWLVSFVS